MAAIKLKYAEKKKFFLEIGLPSVIPKTLGKQ